MALTLAIGVATAFNLITVSVLLAAFHRGRVTGDYSLSENATQVLIAGFGGFIGILGGYVGGTAVERARQSERAHVQDQLDTLAESNGHTAQEPPTGLQTAAGGPPGPQADTGGQDLTGLG